MLTNRQLNTRVRIAEFNARVREMLDEAISDGDGDVDRPAVIQRIMTALPDLPAGEEYDFYITGCARAVRAFVERLGKERRDDDDDQQRLLGYEHIRPRYNIQRDGRQIQIPTLTMSEAEVRTKAKEIRRQGFGMLQEADELERFADRLAAQSPSPGA